METTVKQDTVLITFNGQEKTLTYRPQEQVKAILERALDAFGIQANRHLMALFTEGGAELPDNSSAEAAGIKPGEVLILRPSNIRGGDRR
jgi:hypothetical protein